MGRQPGQSGWVDWPHPSPTRWHDTGEGGMWVYAFWPYDTDQAFVRCNDVESTIALPMPDFVTSDKANEIYLGVEELGNRAVTIDGQIMAALDAGTPVLAAVCLGSTSSSYANPAGAYWQCTVNDLTDEGMTLIRLLTMLYRRRVVLITYLDT
jgi:hypothetical protein